MQSSEKGQKAVLLRHHAVAANPFVHSNSMALGNHLILGTEVCPFVVELLQGTHILTNDCCVQICSKLTFSLQGTTAVGPY